MPTNSGTLASFIPADFSGRAGNLQQVSIVRKGTMAFLRFPAGVSSYAERTFLLPRPGAGSTLGYTATTGVKVIVHWMSDTLQSSGVVVWGAQIVPIGQTDLIRPDTADQYYSLSLEVFLPFSVNVAGGGGNANMSVLSIPKNVIKGSLTTDAVGGDAARFRLRRAGAPGGSDTLQGDALIYLIELQDY